MRSAALSPPCSPAGPCAVVLLVDGKEYDVGPWDGAADPAAGSAAAAQSTPGSDLSGTGSAEGGGASIGCVDSGSGAAGPARPAAERSLTLSGAGPGEHLLALALRAVSGAVLAHDAVVFTVG